MRVGVWLFGIGSVAAGVLNLYWGEFEPAHQPIQAWGDHIPLLKLLVWVAALWLIAGGIAIQWRRSTRVAAGALAIPYAFFALFPLPRVYTAPHFLGYHFSVFVGLLVNVCQQLILAVPAAVFYISMGRREASVGVERAARWIFGLCCIDFGLGHLTAVQAVAPMVPTWFPLGGAFWTVATGVAFLLVGLAVITGVQDVLAAQLLGVMLLVFSVVVLAPHIFAKPHGHVVWGSNAYNLAAVGAAWMFAGWLASRARPASRLRVAS